ncbi:MAG: hypothetical protein FIB07_11380 [Candidatus Methanoperedens sp.]|nr:hypothetical protein [Candidatus Methanoperedens sp.]
MTYPIPPAGGQVFPQGKPWAHSICGRRGQISFCMNERAVLVFRILFRERDSVRYHINRECPGIRHRTVAQHRPRRDSASRTVGGAPGGGRPVPRLDSYTIIDRQGGEMDFC